MKSNLHPLYIAGSIASALVAAGGILAHAPIVYGVIPGLIGGILAAVAAVQFFWKKEDLAGFVATVCGFVFYQAYQANPLTLPDFTAYIDVIPEQDQVAGILLSNLTAAMLLIAYHIVSFLFGSTVDRWLPRPSAVTRIRADGAVLVWFILLFVAVALPNVFFGKVVVGPFQSILNQRSAWGDTSLGGYAVFGGAVGGSFVNVTLWATSLFLLWMYLLGSRFRLLMWILAPLVLLWTAAVSLQGTRTYVVILAVAVGVYVFGSPRVGRRAFFHMLWTVPLLVLIIQVSAAFRTAGLAGFNGSELAAHALELRGNEGASSQMDGIEYFRTELLDRGIAPNPVVGLLKGTVMRPIEGALMVVPRSVFPWKADDQTAVEYNLFFQNVRLGVQSNTAFLGASPGLIGRELIRYGLLGPLTMLFWMGLVLMVANRLYRADPGSPFHRICAAALASFFIAQSRDFVPVWFIPLLPAGVILLAVSLRSRKWHSAEVRSPQEPVPVGSPRRAG